MINMLDMLDTGHEFTSVGTRSGQVGGKGGWGCEVKLRGRSWKV